MLRSAINRVAVCTANLIATGDDEGAVKACDTSYKMHCVHLLIQTLQLWDPRKRTAIRAYTRHFDFISDILFFEDKNHLVTTRSADQSPTDICQQSLRFLF